MTLPDSSLSYDMGIQTVPKGMAQERKIWIKFMKINEDESISYETKEVTLEMHATGKATKKRIMETFGISQDRVIKLRNLRGSLVPINSELPPNSPTRPYTLECCNRYEHVTPRPRTVSVPSYEQILKRKLEILKNRLDKLEETVPRLPEIQKTVLDQEIKELNDKMEFLNARLKDDSYVTYSMSNFDGSAFWMYGRVGNQAKTLQDW